MKKDENEEEEEEMSRYYKSGLVTIYMDKRKRNLAKNPGRISQPLILHELSTLL